MSNLVKAGLIIFIGGYIVLFFIQNFTRWTYEPDYIHRSISPSKASASASTSTGDMPAQGSYEPFYPKDYHRSQVKHTTLHSEGKMEAGRKRELNGVSHGFEPAPLSNNEEHAEAKRRSELNVVSYSFEEPRPLPKWQRAEDVFISAQLNQSHEDRAGVGQNFSSGPGSRNPTYEDWNWTMTLQLYSSRTINLVHMRLLNGFEAWSTYSDQAPICSIQECYPLVIYLQGERLNFDYRQQLGSYGPGQYEFKLFGQMGGTSSFPGAELTVEFTDRTYVSTIIPAHEESAHKEPARVIEKWDKGI